MTATTEEPLQADLDHAAEVPDAAGAAPSRSSWLRPVGRALAVFSLSRAVVFAAIIMGGAVANRRPLASAFHYWDGGWWIAVIDQGYPRQVVEEGGRAVQSTVAFFPGFPLIARGVESLFGVTPLQAGVIVSTLAGALSAVLLWFFAARLADDAVADRAVALFSFFPSSFVLLTVYSEGVMIAFTLGSMLAALRRRWMLAGLLAAGATLTRPTALALVPALAVTAVIEIRRRRDWLALTAPLLAPLGAIGYFLFLKHHTGELGAWFRVQSDGWGYDRPDWGTRALERTADLLFSDPLADVNVITGTLAALYILVAAYFLLRWKPPALVTIFTLLVSFQILTGGLPSRPRYIMNAFPLIVAVAWRLRTVWTYTMTLAVSACLLGVYTLMSTSTTLSIP